jgi:hypothetical protein
VSTDHSLSSAGAAAVLAYASNGSTSGCGSGDYRVETYTIALGLVLAGSNQVSFSILVP